MIPTSSLKQKRIAGAHIERKSYKNTHKKIWECSHVLFFLLSFFQFLSFSLYLSFHLPFELIKNRRNRSLYSYQMKILSLIRIICFGLLCVCFFLANDFCFEKLVYFHISIKLIDRTSPFFLSHVFFEDFC